MNTGEPVKDLKEARNTGEWLEARIHLLFTEIADTMFGEGRLSRDERIALSSAIGGALDAFRTTVEADAAGLYQRDIYDGPEAAGEMIEAGELSPAFVPLVEKAVRRDGTIPIKVIAPGWGSSGYYPAEVLERDGPKIFGEGLQMFWDHQTPTEEAERPEGELDDLAAVLTGPARWEADGPAGAGLYADAKVFPSYAESIDSLAPHIGVSIRANGRAVAGEAEGQRGAIVQEITSAKSIDFVTKPGAGGQIISMFEAARPSRDITEEKTDVDEQKLQEAQEQIAKLTADNARLSEALTLRDATEFVRQTLNESTLPDVTKGRLVEALAANPPIKDGVLDEEVYATRIAEAVATETTYLQQVAGYGAGNIEGMGGGSQPVATQPDEAAEVARMAEAFRSLGMTEAEAKIAAAGRI